MYLWIKYENSYKSRTHLEKEEHDENNQTQNETVYLYKYLM